MSSYCHITTKVTAKYLFEGILKLWRGKNIYCISMFPIAQLWIHSKLCLYRGQKHNFPFFLQANKYQDANNQESVLDSYWNFKCSLSSSKHLLLDNNKLLTILFIYFKKFWYEMNYNIFSGFFLKIELSGIRFLAQADLLAIHKFISYSTASHITKCF